MVDSTTSWSSSLSVGQFKVLRMRWFELHFVNAQQLTRCKLSIPMMRDGNGPTNTLVCHAHRLMASMMLKFTEQKILCRGYLHRWLSKPGMTGMQFWLSGWSQTSGEMLQMYSKQDLLGNYMRAMGLSVAVWFWMKEPGTSWLSPRRRPRLIYTKLRFSWR